MAKQKGSAANDYSFCLIVYEKFMTEHYSEG